MELALFDFDNTITKRDSLIHFTAFAKGKFKCITGITLLSPAILLNRIGIFSAQFTKNLFLGFFFKGRNAEEFNLLCKRYAATALMEIVDTSAMQTLQWHKQNGHRIIIVSASPENYLLPWCNELELELMATKLRVINNKLTGKIEGCNCKGSEKKRRLLAEIRMDDYDEIYGYGNNDDKEMLSLCTKPHLDSFK